MDLMEGETVRSSAIVNADDTSESAFLFVTDRRLVIEFSKKSQEVVAAVTAAIRGEQVPHPIDAPLAEVTQVQVVRRPFGPSILKLTARGRSTIWLTEKADLLAAEIRRGIEALKTTGRYALAAPPRAPNSAGARTRWDSKPPTAPPS